MSVDASLPKYERGALNRVRVERGPPQGASLPASPYADLSIHDRLDVLPEADTRHRLVLAHQLDAIAALLTMPSEGER